MNSILEPLNGQVRQGICTVGTRFGDFIPSYISLQSNECLTLIVFKLFYHDCFWAYHIVYRRAPFLKIVNFTSTKFKEIIFAILLRKVQFLDEIHIQ